MLKILTQLYKSCNYGGMLQSFALYRFLAIKGNACQQIAYIRQSHSFGEKIKRISLQKILRKCELIISVFLTKPITDKLSARRRMFTEFMERVPYGAVYDASSVALSVERDDIIIAGSDQIWNPDWRSSSKPRIKRFYRIYIKPVKEQREERVTA